MHAFKFEVRCLIDNAVRASQASTLSTVKVIVGTIMKPSRAADFSQRGLVHLLPQDGVTFVPVDLTLPLTSQALLSCPISKRFLLVKATDFLEVDVASGSPRFQPSLLQVRSSCNQATRQL
jgi:hypothetical protein